MTDSLNKFDFFHFYRLEDFASDTLRQLLSQLLETYLDEGNCICLVNLDKSQFEHLAQAYRDLCIGFKHPRSNSACRSFRPNDRTLLKLAQLFPDWNVLNPADLP